MLAAAVHRQLALAVAPAHRQMAATALVGLEGAALLGEKPLKLLRAHEYTLVHTYVEVHINVEAEVNRALPLQNHTRRSNASKPGCTLEAHHAAPLMGLQLQLRKGVSPGSSL